MDKDAPSDALPRSNSRTLGAPSQGAVQQGDALTPLHWPGGVKPSFESIRPEGFWKYVPIFSHIGRYMSWERMMKPIYEQLDAQLASRPPTWDRWRAVGARLGFIQLLSRFIADEMGWPNALFFPEDPLEIVLSNRFVSDGSDLLAIFVNAERATGIKLRAAVDRGLANATYGRLVHRCWAAVEESPWARNFGNT